jgi:hypothetical protein
MNLPTHRACDACGASTKIPNELCVRCIAEVRRVQAKSNEFLAKAVPGAFEVRALDPEPGDIEAGIVRMEVDLVPPHAVVMFDPDYDEGKETK